MPTPAEIISSKIPTYTAQKMEPDMAVRLAVLDWFLSLFGAQMRITSGFRSLAQQKYLYQQWAWGVPGIFKPAQRSWHTVGRAVDLSMPQELLPLAGHVWKILGGRWGGDFTDPDPVHFDLPGPTPPPAAY